MARYDLYRSSEGTLLLDVQSPLLGSFGTRVVIPLVPERSTPNPIRRLHPVFDIAKARYVLATHLVSAVPETILGQPAGNLSAHHDEIVAALDMLFQGY